MNLDNLKTFAGELAATSAPHDPSVVNEFAQLAVAGVVQFSAPIEDAFRFGASIAAKNKFGPDSAVATDALLRDEKLMGRIMEAIRGEK